MPNPLIQRIPKPVRSVLRRIYYFPQDVLDALLGRRDPLTPPRGLMFVGDGDFRKTGEEFLKHFIELARLRPDERVLDVGCGIGRMAAPLTRHLKGGSYEGFDIVPEGIEWCHAHITTKYSHFQFQLAEVRNKAYNPQGRVQASEYRFAYPDSSFDFAFATSVFTHMLPAELDRYVSETARVLKPRGRLLATFFLLNAESLQKIESRKSRINFCHSLEGFRTSDLRTPESAVAYPEEFIRNLFARHGLTITEPLRYGSWSGRSPFLSYQDIALAQKQ